MFLALLLHLRFPFPLPTRSRFFNEKPEVFEPEALTSPLFSRFIQWTFSVSRNPTSTCLCFSESMVSLRCDRTHFQPGILSPDGPHASGGFVIFVKQGILFGTLYLLSPFALPSLYVGVNISLNNFLALFP